VVVMAEDAIVAGAAAGAGSWGGKRIRVRIASSVLSSGRAFHCGERGKREREKEGRLGVGNREEGEMRVKCLMGERFVDEMRMRRRLWHFVKTIFVFFFFGLGGGGGGGVFGLVRK